MDAAGRLVADGDRAFVLPVDCGVVSQSASSSSASSRKVAGRKPSLQESIAERGFFIQPS